MTSAVLIFFFTSALFAQEYETVVEDFLFNTSSRVIITEETIRKSQSTDIPTLLATQANISVVNTPFQPTSLSLRGGDSGHTLILVDGIPFYDPSTIQRTGNISTLNIKSVKKIEVIKGSQSVLYGGQALAGVIKIETLNSEPSHQAYAELGSKNHIAGGIEKSWEPVTVRGYWLQRDSASPAKNSDETYYNQKQNTDVIYRWNKKSYVKVTHLKDDGFSPSSDINYNIVDVDNYKLSNEQNSISSQILMNEQSWQPRLSLNLQNSIRHYDFPLSAVNSDPIHEDYKTHFQFLRFDIKPYKDDFWSIEAGAHYLLEDFQFIDKGSEIADRLLEQRGVFAKANFKSDEKMTLSFGSRLDSWSKQDPVSVYHLGLQYEKTKFEISTGYKTPTLYQLFSSYGNQKLKAENGTQYSLIQDFENMSVTLFYSEFKDLITTKGTFPNLQYVNVNKSQTWGIESTVQYENISLNMGYQEPRDLKNNRWLVRRPLLNGSLRYMLSQGKVDQSAEVVYVGKRNDFSPTGISKLSDYFLLNYAYTYHYETNRSLYTRIENLTHHRYQETYGFYDEGISAVLGWNIIF